ncbi:MAG: ABC transporter permease [Candidatus Thermoplasmatota archaeon]|nr:ABC transporter permease [Candidatus Thermoplasmatota archaeon]
MRVNLLLNLRALVGRAYPRIIGAQREPSWIFFETLLPLLTIAAYVYIYEYLGVPQFVGFVVLGGTMVAFWMNILWSMAAQFYWEKQIGNLQLYMMAPMSRMALLGGMAVGGAVMTSTRAVATLVLGVLIFRITLVVLDPLLLLAIFLTTLAALYGLGMIFASVYLLYGREAWHASNLLQEPVFLVSGFYFPLKTFVTRLGAGGLWVAAGASIIPMTLGLDAMRQLLFPELLAYGLLRPDIELLILLILAPVFIYLARISLAYLERLGKEQGRLTLRHQ